MDAGVTPLFMASYHGHVSVVKVLVSSGANVEHSTDMGDTALSIAIEQGHTVVAKFLVQGGALGTAIRS